MNRRKVLLAVFLLAGMSIWTACGTVEQKAEISQKTVETEETDEGEQTEQKAGTEEQVEAPDLHAYDFTVAFAGDINLADNWSTMEYYEQQENGIYDCIDPELIRRMQEADLTCVNLEFCMSDRGMPMEGKKYTFRAKPERVEILKELGVDLANLANNHIYDYGTDAFLDTLDILDAGGIAHAGAGKNAVEAEEPFYAEIDGRTVAVVSATRAEKYILTPEADEDNPGVFRCYDMAKVLQKVQETKEKADFVIAYIHWGTEYSETLETAQTEGARELIDAGADVVLGAHPHCLQGMEYYNGKPILYSLGNYWFNEKTLDTILAELHFYGNDEEQHLEVTAVPARQEAHYTRLLTEHQEVETWNRHVESMEPHTIKIDKEGVMRDGDQTSESEGTPADEEAVSAGVSEE